MEHLNPDLEAFSAHNCQSFDDECASVISKHCPKLTNISFSGLCARLSSVGISSFVENCRNLSGVSVISAESEESTDEVDNSSDNGNSDDDKEWVLSDDIFASFLQRTDLQVEHFELCGFENITSSGLRQFLAHTGQSLKSLDLSELPAVDNSIVEELGDVCPNLTHACFSHCKLADQSMQMLCSKCKMLQSVNFSGCQDISDDSVIALSTSCASLKKVQLQWCIKLTEKSLDALVTNCHNLTSIDMSQCGIRHVPFGILQQLSLQELKLQGCTAMRCPPLNIASQGLRSCRDFLKKCNLQPLCRLTFLGNQGSGKTSLMTSLPTMTQSYADATTEGVHVGFWKPFKSGKGLSFVLWFSLCLI